jgi:hypothetical protein
MNEASTSNEPFPADFEEQEENITANPPPSEKKLADFWENLVKIGLGEATLRVGTVLVTLVLILTVVWVMNNYYLKGEVASPQSAAVAAALPTETPPVEPPVFTFPELSVVVNGIPRLAQLHTTLPTRPRFDITTYEVQPGDTLFTIAERFGLNPATLLWGNPKTLPDPHWLQVGQVLNILPSDGVLYEWHEGDGLNGVAKYYNVTPEDIINWPGNNLSPETIGDYAMPNIEPGAMIFVPGGQDKFVDWRMPRITRDNPAVARTVGAGFCGTIYDGAVGRGSFIWPSATTWISGYRFQPEINHFGIDIGGSTGVAIYASDNGVIVYSGWNDFGYGNLIVIDHGNGWQTYYAHLSTIYAGCGQSVFTGDTIGLMGSTGRSSGPHLHFEMRSDTFGKVDPLNFIQ